MKPIKLTIKIPETEHQLAIDLLTKNGTEFLKKYNDLPNEEKRWTATSGNLTAELLVFLDENRNEPNIVCLNLIDNTVQNNHDKYIYEEDLLDDQNGLAAMLKGNYIFQRKLTDAKNEDRDIRTIIIIENENQTPEYTRMLRTPENTPISLF